MRKRSKSTPSLLGPDALQIGARTINTGNSAMTTLAVIGYPREVRTGWLDSLINYPGSVDVSLFVKPVSAITANDKLQRQLARLESSRRFDARNGRLQDPATEAAALDAQQLAQRLVKGETKLFRIGIYLCVRADGEQELTREVARLRALLSSLLVDVRPTTFRMLSGWKTVLPFGVDHIKGERTFDSDALGASFPFIGSGFNTTDGVFYGLNANGAGAVFWDRFAQANFNSVILARSGSGKSYLAKLEILRSLYRGIDVFVVDPENEYQRLTESVGGTYLQLGHSDLRINPFDLGNEPDALMCRCLFLHSFVAVLLGEELDTETKALLDAAILATYERAGITSDPRTHRRQAPLLVDLVHMLNQGSTSACTLATKLEPFASGSYSQLFSGRTTVQPKGHLVTFSLRGLADEQKTAATLLCLDYIWRAVSDPADQKPRLVTVDEAWLLMRDPVGAKFLFRLAKSARKYWCGLTVITQDAADLLGSELGQAIVANSTTQILLAQASQAIDQLTEAFKLTAGEKAFLLAADRGEAILSTGPNKRVALRTVASDAEHELITTDPGELAALAGEATS